MVGSVDKTRNEPIPGFSGPKYMSSDPDCKDSAKVYASSWYPVALSMP